MFEEALTFDDVLLVPKFSGIKHRSDIDTSVELSSFGNKFKFSHPIIPANMKNVTGKDMAAAVAESNGLSIIHRFMSVEDQIIAFQSSGGKAGISLGVQEEDKLNFFKFYDAGVRIFCIDIAHADSEVALSMLEFLKTSSVQYEIFIIVGNIVTADAAKRLYNEGADAVKIGVGSGSICTTRIETGNGVPQLTALIDVAKIRDEFNNRDQDIVYSNGNRKYLISDGGCKNSGDIVKALCFADMVMVGNLFAGCDEAPGECMTINNHQKVKEYDGSSTHKNTHIEGIKSLVECSGSFKDVLSKLIDGVTSGCSYQGAKYIKQLQTNPRFVRISNAGMIESKPHNVIFR
jgi:IMP dehydrogenase